MNKYDERLLVKLIEKRQSNSCTDNSVIITFKAANKIYVKNELVSFDKTSDKRTLKRRLERLQKNGKISFFEPNGDKTFKVLIDLPKSKRRKKSSISSRKTGQMTFLF